MYINYKDNTERNFYGITADQAEYMDKNSMEVWYEEDIESYVIYDNDGNDIAVVHSMSEFEF